MAAFGLLPQHTEMGTVVQTATCSVYNIKCHNYQYRTDHIRNGLGTMETIIRLLRPYKVLKKADPTIRRRYDIIILALFLYVKQRFTNIDLWTTLLLARFLHINRSASITCLAELGRLVFEDARRFQVAEYNPASAIDTFALDNLKTQTKGVTLGRSNTQE